MVGVAFFLKLSFDNNWIGPLTRVLLAGIAGLGLIGAGEFWRVRYPIYAQTLSGGGVALMYLSIFASFATYAFIGLYTAVGLLLFIGAASAVLGIRSKSMALAVIGILGAFSGPFILDAFKTGDQWSAPAGGPFSLLLYIAVVDVGVFALSAVRNWQWFVLLAVVGSIVTYGAWLVQYGETASLLVAQGGLTLIFVLLVGATCVFPLLWRYAFSQLEQVLMVTTGAAYLAVSYWLMWDDFRAWLGGFTLLVTLF
jgi:uncharacterized membrane protein